MPIKSVGRLLVATLTALLLAVGALTVMTGAATATPSGCSAQHAKAKTFKHKVHKDTKQIKKAKKATKTAKAAKDKAKRHHHKKAFNKAKKKQHKFQHQVKKLKKARTKHLEKMKKWQSKYRTCVADANSGGSGSGSASNPLVDACKTAAAQDPTSQLGQVCLVAGLLPLPA